MPSLTRRQLFMPRSLFVFPHSPHGDFYIHPRSEWAIDRPPKGPLAAEEVKFLIVHHSASDNGHTGEDAPAILRRFYDFHTGTRGWNDIAYNFVIDADGGIWEGRFGSLDGPVAGDATGGNQGFTQLVCVIGDYNTARPSRASLDSLVWLLAWLADRYRISTAPGAEVGFVSRGSNLWPAGVEVITPTVTGHRAMSETTCPGDNLWSYVEGELPADVHALRLEGLNAAVPPVPRASMRPTNVRAAPSVTLPAARPRAVSAVPSSTRPRSPATSNLFLGLATGAVLAGVAGILAWRYRRLTRR